MGRSAGEAKREARKLRRRAVKVGEEKGWRRPGSEAAERGEKVGAGRESGGVDEPIHGRRQRLKLFVPLFS